MLDRLFGQSATPALERATAFYSARHELLAENIVNLSTPGYRQKDLDVGVFQDELRKLIERRNAPPAEAGSPRSDSANSDSLFELATSEDSLVFHDGNDRSVEELMSDQAKNALQHNLAVELLRKQYALFDLALRERIA